jgi:hypothetical protein
LVDYGTFDLGKGYVCKKPRVYLEKYSTEKFKFLEKFLDVNVAWFFGPS